MHLRLLLGAAALAAALTACTEPRAAAAPRDDSAPLDDRRVSRRDSAGVEIVTTSAPMWDAGEAWVLSAQPVFRVSDSALGLRRVSGLARLAGGTVAAVEGGSGTIVLIDGAGEVTRRIDGPVAGRRFRQLFWIGASGDTLLAYDLADHRLVRIPPAGDPAAVALRPVAQSSFTALRPLGSFAGGDILAASGGSSFPFRGEEYEVVRDSAVLLRYAPNGRVRDTLAIVPWLESFGVAAGAGERRMIVPLPRPYGRATSAAAAGDRLYIGTGEQYEVTVHDTTGRLVRVVRIPTVPDSLTPEAVDSFRARVRRRVERGDTALADRALEAALDQAPYPATVPAYERLMVAPDGVIWVLDAAPMTRRSVIWRVFDAGGRWLGIVPMPARFIVHQIGTDYVLGTWAEDDGGHEVRLYGIERGPPVR